MRLGWHVLRKRTNPSTGQFKMPFKICTIHWHQLRNNLSVKSSEESFSLFFFPPSLSPPWSWPSAGVWRTQPDDWNSEVMLWGLRSSSSFIPPCASRLASTEAHSTSYCPTMSLHRYKRKRLSGQRIVCAVYESYSLTEDYMVHTTDVQRGSERKYVQYIPLFLHNGRILAKWSVYYKRLSDDREHIPNH